MAGIPERVAKGAAFLDLHDPHWWESSPVAGRAIHLDTLDLAETADCVLGQRCPLEVLAQRLDVPVDRLDPGDFTSAYWAYATELSGLTGAARVDWGIDHGFSAETDRAPEFADLTAEWRRVILARRSA